MEKAYIVSQLQKFVNANKQSGNTDTIKFMEKIIGVLSNNAISDKHYFGIQENVVNMLGVLSDISRGNNKNANADKLVEEYVRNINAIFADM